MSRAEELADYLEAVALGEREATDAEVDEAISELDKLLPDLPAQDPEAFLRLVGRACEH